MILMLIDYDISQENCEYQCQILAFNEGSIF